MSSYIRIWIHYIWATKYRRKIITRDIKFLLYDHIRANAEEKDIYIDHINGTEDHIHLLVSLKGHQCPSKIVFYIKGESSHWVNQNKLTKEYFEWQNTFMALSVSDSDVTIIRNYIRNQENHHQQKR